MPSGQTHAIYSVIGAAAIGAITYQAGHHPANIGAAVGGCLLGILLTPDLDVRGEIRSNRVVDHSFGGLIGAFWRLIWWPYARLIPRHRHFLSHAPLIGTAGRALYVAAWIMAGAGLAGLWPLPWAAWLGSQAAPGWLALVLGGLAVSDILHWFADSLF